MYNLQQQSSLYVFLFILNYIISFLIALSFITFLNEKHVVSLIFIFLAIFDHFFTGYLFLALIIIPLFIVLLSLHKIFKVLTAIIFITFFSLLNVFLIIDRVIFAMFKFHFNGLVINVITTPGGWEAMHIPLIDIMIALAVIAFIFAVELVAWWILQVKLYVFTNKILFKTVRTLVIVWLIIFIFHRTTFAIADIKNNNLILNTTKIIPLYTPITIKKFLSKYTNFKWEKAIKLENISNKEVNYPLSIYDSSPLKSSFSIIWIVADSLRYDVLNEDNMPNSWKLSQKSQVFHEHYSGGNATRTGLFTLFYGIHGSYWHSFLRARKGPFIIDRLIESEYKFFIASGISLSFPEFKQTNFIKIVNYIHDSYDGKTSDARDFQATKDLINFIQSLKIEDKFFSMLLLDSSHSTYNFPDNFAKYTPYTKEYHYAEVFKKDLVHKIVNRYKNSVYYVDYLIGLVIDALKSANRLQNTIILITGDHAEEFYEYGFWGHVSGYSPAQIKVPMILYVPTMPAQHYYHKTQHQDIAPTILKLLGDTNDISIHSVGKFMFEQKKELQHKYLVSCGWEKCALIDEFGWLIFGTETYSLAQNETLDIHYKPMRSALSEENLQKRNHNIINMLYEFKKFLK